MTTVQFRSIFICMVVLSFLASIPISVVAQESTPSNSEHQRRKEARDMMESIRIWKITEELNVDEELAVKLFPRINESSRIRRQNDQEVQRAIDQLGELLKHNAPESDIQTALSHVLDARDAGYQAMKRAENQILELLSPRQKAQYLILESEFPRKIRDFMSKHQNQKRARGEMGEGPPWMEQVPCDSPEPPRE